MNPNRPGAITDQEVNNLETSGYREGDYVPGRGRLTPMGTFQGGSEPTIGQSLGTNQGAYDQLESIKQQALSIQDILNSGNVTFDSGSDFRSPAQTQYGSPEIENYLYDIASTPVDEQAIRQNQLKMFQGEIDAVNQIYDQYLREAQQEGEGRLGSQRAMSARGGLLGSDFASAQKGKIQQYNTGIEQGIQAERSAKIAGILGLARKASADEIAAKNQARREGAESYLNYLKSSRENKANNINNVVSALMAQGINPTELSSKELTGIANELGTSTDDIIARYQIAGTQGTGDQFTLKPGEVRYDSAGNVVAEGGDDISNKIYSTSRGLVRLNPETGNPELIFSTGGGGSSAKPAFTSGNVEVDKSTASEISKYLESSRGEDGFTNTEDYVNVISQLLDQGAILDDVLDNYDPRDYVNPSDPTVPGYIKRRLPDAGGGLNININDL